MEETEFLTALPLVFFLHTISLWSFCYQSYTDDFILSCSQSILINLFPNNLKELIMMNPKNTIHV